MQAVCIRVHAFFEYSFVVKRVASYRLSVRRKSGTVPNLGGLTTDEYSFVIKCPASRHLPMRRKTPPPCRGGGSKSRRGFPPTCHSAKGTKRPLWPPQGKQKGIMAAARRTEGALRPVGVRPPPPLRGSSPCKAGQFIPGGFDCRHSEVCKSRNSLLLNSFFQMVLNPQECGLFPFGAVGI